MTMLAAWLSGKSPELMAHVINWVTVQNLLAFFCCVLGKDTLQHFPILGDLTKLLRISVISLILKNFNWIAITWDL